MKTKYGVTLGLAAALLLLPTAGWSENEIQESGFLDDYSSLAAIPDREGAYMYTAPEWDPKEYSKFIIEPIEIWIHQESEYKGVDPDNLKALADSFHKALAKELGDAYPLVDEPGPGVAVARLALTNVMLKKKKLLKWYTFTPVGAVATGTKKAAGKDIRLAHASLEIELLDSRTGKRLRAGMETQAGEKLREKLAKEKKDPDTSWGDIEKTLQFYAKRFRQGMDAARGVATR